MEKQIQLNFSISEINIILKGLGELPAKDSLNIINKIMSESNKRLEEIKKESEEI